MLVKKIRVPIFNVLKPFLWGMPLCLIAQISFSNTMGLTHLESEHEIGLNVPVMTQLASEVYAIPPKLNAIQAMGKQLVDMAGTVIEGPVVINGRTWWHVDFTIGIDGWISENALVAVSGPLGQSESKYSMVSSTPQVVSWPIRVAYPGIEYNIRLGIIGGKYPYTFYLKKAPAGMAIDHKTGQITWTPSMTLEGQSFPVKIAIYDDLQQQITQVFTLKVTKTGFSFVAPNGSDESGDGSLEKPWQSISYGVSQGNETSMLYARGGNYTEVIQFAPGKTNKLLAFPGERPSVDVNFNPGGANNFIYPQNDFGIIDGFEFKNCRRYCFEMTGKASDWIFRRNHMHHLYDDSPNNNNPAFLLVKDANAFTSFRYVIQDNIFHDLFDRASGEHGDLWANKAGSAMVLFDTHYALVEDNIAYNIDGFGYHDKDQSFKNTYRNNLAYNVWETGLSLSNQYYASNIDVLYNTLVGAQHTGLRIGHQNNGQLGNILVQHNTIFGSIEHRAGKPVGGVNSIQIRDNIISNKGYVNPAFFCCNGLSGGSWATNTLLRDFNVFQLNDRFVAGKWGSKFTADQWRKMGFDNHSLFLDPMLTDPANNDFTPRLGSPVCGAASDGSDIGAESCEAQMILD
ncbi:putative Ig domain-containing protein [Zooshikella sp. RANM57]|uniref:putative Ig domain-containing protein n=1 Tax=Zooshikella sp. RANM57 TaxID=3425863 RepID=UPI003D700047